MNKITKSSLEHFSTKALEDGSVYIEGWANKAVVDRGKDLISPKAWDVNNYKKNSIILFNHDHSKPIGKMISVDLKEEGLFVKGRISNSKDPEISRVRDLVKEGILNSLSVGIMVKDEDMKDGVNHIKSVELHEVSVVAVPMNQDSQFTVTAKSMQAPLLDVLKQISNELGQSEVSKAYDKLASSEEVFTSVDHVAKSIAKLTKATDKEAHGFVNGSLSMIPLKIKNWLENKSMDEDQKPLKEETPKEEVKEDAKVDVFAIRVPKSAVASVDELTDWAESSGWKSDNVVEEEESYLLVQRPKEDFVGEFKEADMGDGVIGLVGELKPQTESEDSEEEEISVEVEVESDEEESMDEKQALLDDVPAVTEPVNGMTADQIEVNPALDQAKQTNVLLANMVSLLQQLNEKFDSMPMQPHPMMSQEETLSSEEDEEDLEIAKKLKSFMMKTEDRLKVLGL